MVTAFFFEVFELTRCPFDIVNDADTNRAQPTDGTRNSIVFRKLLEWKYPDTSFCSTGAKDGDFYNKSPLRFTADRSWNDP